MSRIVLVHGIGQQSKGPESLLNDWLPALRDGVVLAGSTPPEAADVAMAFYGDLFRPVGRAVGEPDLDASDITDSFDEDLLLAWWREAASTDPGVTGPDAETRLRTPLLIQRALNALGHSKFFAHVSDRALILSLRQVHCYFTESMVRNRAIDRVAQQVSSRTRVIVGHSLGSVVAYEALCAHPEWQVETFISLGSPLGMRGLVFDRLTPPPQQATATWPTSLKFWTNIADRGDIVAAQKNLSPLFGSRVNDVLVHNGTKAHDVRPYLTAKETGAAIVAAIESTHPDL